MFTGGLNVHSTPLSVNRHLPIVMERGKRKVVMAEEIVEDVLTRYGLRRIHAISMGEAFSLQQWLARVSVPAQYTVNVWRWHEKALDIYHLVMVWKCREVVRITPAQPTGRSGATPILQEAVMWWVDWKRGETIRRGIDEAAGLYMGMLDETPNLALVKSIPKDREPFYRLEWQDGKAEIRIEAAGWVPDGFVVVRKEAV